MSYDFLPIYLNIPIIGLTSSGKSTLLNAMLGTPVSQTSKLRTTLSPIEFKLIQSDSKNPDSKIADSRVEDFEKIIEKISESNKKLKTVDSSADTDIEESTLKFEIKKPEIFQELPEGVVFRLIDLPGIDDSATNKKITKYIDEHFIDNDVILCTIDGNSAMNTDAEVRLVKMLFENVIKHRSGDVTKIIFCITKIDDPEESESQMMVEQATRTIRKLMTEAKIPAELIVDVKFVVCSPLKCFYLNYFQTHKTFAGLPVDTIRKIAVETFGKKASIDYKNPGALKSMIARLDAETPIESIKNDLDKAGWYKLFIELQIRESDFVDRKLVGSFCLYNIVDYYEKCSEYFNKTFGLKFEHFDIIIDVIKDGIWLVRNAFEKDGTLDYDEDAFKYIELLRKFGKTDDGKNIKTYITEDHKKEANEKFKTIKDPANIVKLYNEVHNHFGFKLDIEVPNFKKHIMDSKTDAYILCGDKSDVGGNESDEGDDIYAILIELGEKEKARVGGNESDEGDDIYEDGKENKNYTNPAWKYYAILIELGEKEKARDLIITELKFRYKVLLRMYGARKLFYGFDKLITDVHVASVVYYNICKAIFEFWNSKGNRKHQILLGSGRSIIYALDSYTMRFCQEEPKIVMENPGLFLAHSRHNVNYTFLEKLLLKCL